MRAWIDEKGHSGNRVALFAVERGQTDDYPQFLWKTL
jgi:hypothetical protein